MTIAFVLGARKSNPQEYDESVDIFRGINEALLAICIIYNLLVEIYQFKRYILCIYLYMYTCTYACMCMYV